MWQSARVPQDPNHHVQRICDANYKGFWAVFFYSSSHLAHDGGVDTDQVVAAHSRFPRHASGDDNDVRITKRCITVCALYRCIEALDCGGLLQIECLTLRHSLYNVEKYNVTQFFES